MTGQQTTPDFSIELNKALVYVDFIKERMNTLGLKAAKEDSDVSLTHNDVEAFGYMLTEAGGIIYQVNEALYSDNPKGEITS